MQSHYGTLSNMTSIPEDAYGISGSSAGRTDYSQRVTKIDVVNVHPYAPVLLQTDFLVSQSTDITQNSQFLQPLLLCKHSDSTGYSK